MNQKLSSVLLLNMLMLFIVTTSSGQTFTVNNTGDAPDINPGDGSCLTALGFCTLRAAVDEANALAGGQIIEFNPALDGQSITIDAKLQITDDNTIINGDIAPADGKPNIRIISGQTGINGFHIFNSANNEIRGFNIVQFTNGITDPSPAPIKIEGSLATNNIIASNYFGTDLNGGVIAFPGNYRSIRIEDEASNNRIGDATPTGINIISNTQVSGVQIVGTVPNPTNNNQITGNIIGLDATGTIDLGNGNNGIEVINAVGTIIGTTGDGRNFISGNNQEGIVLNNSTDGFIVNNYIGTNITGDGALGNNGEGILIENGSTGNQIGDGTAAGRNLISGNSQQGIVLNTATGNDIIGNYIGVAQDGSTDLGHISHGIWLMIGATGNVIGNGAAGGGNVIAGNSGHEILISDGPNTILGNIIGLDAAGNTIVNAPPAGIGIQIVPGANGNQIGDGTADGRNIISGNTLGINIGSDNNIIRGNYIGLTQNGLFSRGNSGDGILLTSTSTNNTIGGDRSLGHNNAISGNTGNGITVNTASNFIYGNMIGLSSNGNIGIGNSGSGILVTADNTMIGSAAVNFGNTISANDYGIEITSGDITTILGNVIGMNANGITDIGNTNEGVIVSGAPTNVFLGDGTLAGANYISGNNAGGIRITGPGVVGVGIDYNFIGLQADGITARSNTGNGITLDLNSSNTSIGNSVIANNTNHGIDIQGGSLSNIFTRNSIYNNTNKGINNGVSLPNQPVVTGLAPDGTISGTAQIGSLVDIFVDAGDEGQTYIATVPCPAGTWSYTANLVTDFPPGQFNITATQLYLGYTSDFSNPFDYSAVFNEFTVINTNDAGAGSLRWVIGNANAVTGTDIVSFNIPNTDPGYVLSGTDERWTILPVTDLPDITESVTLDATSQPGAGNFRIKIDGQDIRTNGFKVNSTPVTFYGFYITNFTSGIYAINPGGGGLFIGDVNKGNVINSCGQGISTGTANNHVIKGNFIGTDETGMLPMGNTTGIGMTTAANVQIGGSLPGEGNIISGNTNDGISFNSGGTNTIESNIIGASIDETLSIPNGVGLSITTTGNFTIINNTISGNSGAGLRIFFAGNNLVQGNYIGIASDGITQLPNAIGILFDPPLSADNNTIGGLGGGEGNTIAYNVNEGIRMTNVQFDFNRIIGNSIFGNGAKGIELGGVGNDNKQAPTIVSIGTGSASGTGTDLDVIHLYRDNSGFSPLQGQEYLGTTTVAGGVWTVAEASILPTDLMNATASDFINNTSEFTFNFGEIDLYQGIDNSGTAVTNAQVTDVDIGSSIEGFDLDQVFTIENDQGVPLNITSITVTGSDYELLQVPATIDQFATGNFILRLSGGTIGTFSATITIISDDEDEGTFTFPVTGSIVVNATPDPLLVTNVDNGLIPGSLRTVIEYANTNLGPDTIKFDFGIISQEILIQDRLDITDDSTVIDGDILGDCLPHITINGINGGDGFWITGAHTVIKHLNIIKYPGAGIWLKSDSNRVQGNYIGIDLAGADVTDNGNTYGVWAHIGKHNIIGGTTACERNIISGNWWGAVMGGNSSNTDSTFVIGNYLGTDHTGTIAMGVGTTSGTTTGVVVTRTGTHFIGGENPGERNIISSNDWGINISRVTDTVRVIGNYIGLDVTGTIGLGNRSYGIYADTYVKIGNGTSAGRNVISGHTNPAYGIYLTNWNTNPVSNIVLGNYIGTDASGTGSLPNYVGVGAYSGTVTNSNLIGDGTIGGRNVIAYNDYGIDIGGPTVVLGNYIGTDPSGTIAQGNTIGVSAYSSGVTTNIGDGTSSGVNLISGNGTGLDIGWAAADNITINRNYLGVQPDGITPLPNVGDGIYIYNSSTNISIINSIIAYNGGDGVQLNNANISNVSINQNEIYCNTGLGINLNSISNNNIQPPFITTMDLTSVTGTGVIGEDIHVYRDNSSCSPAQGAEYLGTAVVDGVGNWAVTGLTLDVENDFITATATNTTDGTSQFSEVFLDPPGHALDFDGVDDYVNLGNPPELQIGGDLTIEAWVNWAGNTTGSTQTIISRAYDFGESADTDIFYRFGIGTDGRLNDFFEHSGGVNHSVSSKKAINAGVWTHIAMVRNATTLREDFFINGIYVGGGTIPAVPVDGSHPGQRVWIGGRLGNTIFFDGIMDELRVWDVARSSVDILADYCAATPLVGNESGLAGYYKFDQSGNTSILPDRSNNSNKGNLTDFPGDPSANWVTSQALLVAALQPKNLITTEVSNSQIDLSWTDPIDTEDGFNIERSDGNNTNFVQIGSTGANVTTFSDNTVTAGNGYYYRVIGTSLSLNSNPSNEKFASTLSAAGNAIDLDGVDDNFTVRHFESLGGQPGQSLTWSAWIKMPLDISGGAGTIRGILSTTEPNQNDPRIDLYTLKATGNVGVTIQSVGGATTQAITGLSDLRDNEWHHVAFVRDAVMDELRLYVDGTEDTTPLTDDDIDGSNIGDLYIGDWARNPQNGRGFLGQIDEVRLWNVARSQAEIRATLAAPLIGNESGLIRYYRFDQGIPGGDNTTPPIDELPDRSQSNNYGTLVNSALTGPLSNWVVSGEINVQQPFITTWQTTDGQITIPTTGGGYDYNVTWTNLTNGGVGDGSTTNEMGDFLITGLENGSTYQLELTGLFPRIYFNFGSERNKILTVEEWGNTQWTSMANAFYGCGNLTVPAIDAPDLSLVTDMSYMFSDAYNLTGNIGGWDVSNVTNMSHLFGENYALNQSLNSWDVSSVTDMSSMFINAFTFNGDVSSWKVSSVTDMSSTFDGADVFNQDISSWNVVNVTTMNSMFSAASSFNQNIGGWNVSNVTNMSSIFRSATSFDQNIGSWDVSKVNDMSAMFWSATSFNQNIGSWDVSMVTTMESMFRSANTFNQNISLWDVSQVTNMISMFRANKAFDQLIDVWDVSSVTDMSNMFNGADFNQPINNWNVSNVTNMSGMLANTLFFNQDLSSWDVSNVIDMNAMFLDGFVFNQDISGWDVSSVTDMGGMFDIASSFNQNLGSWDVSNVTDMSSMLSDANLSIANYDATLIGWNSLPSLQNGVTLGANGINYCTSNLERNNLISTYGWTITDAGQNCGLCPSQPTADAGLDQIVCEGTVLNLNGVIGGAASTLTWTTSGDGSFDDPTSAIAQYTPGTSDISTGTVTLTLTTDDPDGAGPCIDASASMLITIEPTPTIDVGTDISVCSATPVSLAATIGGTSTGAAWTSTGDGSFDTPTALTPNYTPGTTDISNGTVTLTATTTGVGTCAVTNDQLILTISPPIADAGADLTACEGEIVLLNGTISGSASTITWSTSGDGSFDDTTLATAQYTPGTSDISTGTVTLTLTTDDPDGAGVCLAATDLTIVTIVPQPTVAVDPDFSICEGDVANISAVIGGSASIITWTTSGAGAIDNVNNLIAQYTPGTSDVTTGTVSLTATTDDPDGAGSCLAANASLLITLDAAPIVDAGTDQSVCANEIITVSGTIAGSALTATWTSNGDGSFDNSNSLTANYTLGTSDIIAGVVDLTLTTTATAVCIPVSDIVTITISQPITVIDQSATQSVGETSVIDPASGGSFNAGDVLTTTIDIDPLLGVATVNPDGSINYISNSGTVGTDSFEFTVCNQCGLCSSAQANITINNEPPIVNIPPAAGQAGGLITVDVLSGITDINGNIDLSSLKVIVQPTSGAIASFDADGNLLVNYDGIKFVGTDQLTIEVCDVDGLCTSQIIFIEIAEPSIVVYNAISPNDDGKHDFLEIENAEFFSENKVVILNRWGDIVYEVNGYDNAGIRFEGVANKGGNGELPPGTYFYQIDLNDGSPIVNGFINLRR